MRLNGGLLSHGTSEYVKRMKRKNILEQIEKTYAEIYEYTDCNGDEPLNILDDFCEDANLSDASSDLFEALANDIDPETLSNKVLTQLLQVFKEVVQECKVEFQD